MHIVEQTDDQRHIECQPLGVKLDRRVNLDRLGLLLEQQDHGPLQRDEVQPLIGGIEDKNMTHYAILSRQSPVHLYEKGAGQTTERLQCTVPILLKRSTAAYRLTPMHIPTHPDRDNGGSTVH